MLLKTTDDWRLALDRGELVGTVLIDLSKAFDSIDHTLLCRKLDAYGVRGPEQLWFRNYLANRRQRVVLNGVSSDWADVTRGVPQGSIFGPLLFSLFVNDLPNVVQHCSINLYADDTTIYNSADNPDTISTTIVNDLERIATWIDHNSMKLNICKTQLMVLSRPGQKSLGDKIRVTLRGKEITKNTSVKYLGVMVDQDLKWNLHVAKAQQKCWACLGTIRRACSYLPTATRKKYHALVLPHLDYCSVVWHPCGATLSTQIERIQKYSMRLIFHQPPRTRSEPLRQRLGWTSLHQRRHHALLKQVHRCINKRAPVYLVEKYQTNSNFGTVVHEVKVNYI